MKQLIGIQSESDLSAHVPLFNEFCPVCHVSEMGIFDGVAQMNRRENRPCAGYICEVFGP